MSKISRSMRNRGFLCVPNAALEYFNNCEKASIMAGIIEQHNKTARADNTWFFLSYDYLIDRVKVTHTKVQKVVQEFLEEGLIARKRSNHLGRWRYQFVEQTIFEIFGYPAKDADVPASSENDRNVPVKNDMNKDKKEKKEEKEPCIKGKDSLIQGATTDVVSPGNGLRRRRTSIAPTMEPKEPEKKEQTSLFPNSLVENLFHHWNSLGKPLSSHKINSSKIFQAGIHQLVQALKKHPLHIIKKAMDDYYATITNPHSVLVMLRPGVKVSLPEFFKFSADTQERMIHHPILLTTKSWFEECLLGMDHLEDRFRTHERDIHPKVTEALIAAYQKKVRQEKISVTDRNNFIRAAKFIVEYHAEHRNKINWCSCPQERTSVAMFAYRLIEAIVEDAQDPMLIEPTWLCTERTKEKRLRNYLLKRGLLEQGATPTVVRRNTAPVTPKTDQPRVRRGYDPGYLPGEIE